MTSTGLATILYEGGDDYDFGPNLVLYDYRRKQSHLLTDKATTMQLLREDSLDAHYPPGMEGVGSKVS